MRYASQPASQHYALTIRDLFTVSSDGICDAEAVVSILDGALEIDRVRLSGKMGLGESIYHRAYTGKPGPTAELVSGPDEFSFARRGRQGIRTGRTARLDMLVAKQ